MSGTIGTIEPAGQLISLANTALFRCSAKATLSTLTDGSPEANACALFLPVAIGAMLTAYPWRFAKRIGVLTAEPASTNPLWANEFTKPTDCLKVLGILDPSIPSRAYGHLSDLFEQGMPFDEGYSANGPVLWANLAWREPGGVPPSLSCSYTSSAPTPIQWPNPFWQLVTWALAAEIAIPVTSNGQIAAQMREGIEAAMQTAIMADNPRRFQSTDYVPDWIAVRGRGPEFHEHGWRGFQSTESYPAAYAQDLDAIAASQGNVPSYRTPDGGLYGVPNVGIPAIDIAAGQRPAYLPADTPDGRLGVLTIGRSPIGWRRPFHNEIITSQELDPEAIGAKFAIGDAIGGTLSGEVELP